MKFFKYDQIFNAKRYPESFSGHEFRRGSQIPNTSLCSKPYRRLG
jgi:hypothetical protein